MHKVFSSQSQKYFDILDYLSEQGIIDWPIEYEVNKPTQFELENILDGWLGGKKWRETNHKFIQFGQDGCGSMFCLWLYPELDGEPPVIFLGSEGERFIVSNNIHDFVRQLMSGKLFYDGKWVEPEEEDKEELDWEALDDAAQKFFGKESADPNKLRDTAILKHPDINKWVENNVT